MRWNHFMILGILVLLLGWGIINLQKEKSILQEQINVLTANLNSLDKENKNTEDLIRYYQNPQNLLKELKSRFNYRAEGEKLIIVVPVAASSSN